MRSNPFQKLCACGHERGVHRLKPSISKPAPKGRRLECDVIGCHCRDFVEPMQGQELPAGR